MSIIKVSNVFSPEELKFIKAAVRANNFIPDNNLGRKDMGRVGELLSNETLEKLYAISRQVTDMPLSISHVMAVEYSAEFGQPNLPPHFDGDTNDLIINMQLESNTSWNIGLNTEVYSLEDNEALVFNGNTEVHWRPHKEFKEGEYVLMLFTRFCKPDNRSDYSYLPMNQTDPIFDEARKVRDSLI